MKFLIHAEGKKNHEEDALLTMYLEQAINYPPVEK